MKVNKTDIIECVSLIYNLFIKIIGIVLVGYETVLIIKLLKVLILYFEKLIK